MKKIAKNKEQDLSRLHTETQKSLDKDANIVKIQEYRNQSLEHLAQTCLSLSTQTTDVLNQALPVYQDKINRVMLEEKLNKILGIVSSKNYFAFGFFPIGEDIIKLLFVYVEKVNDFAYINAKTLILGSNQIDLQFEESDHKILKTYDGLVYLMIGSKVTVYDTELNVISTIDNNDSRSAVNFYVYQGMVTFAYRVSSGYKWKIHVRFGEVSYEIGTNATILDIEVVGDRLAIVSKRHTHIMDGINNTPSDDFVSIFDSASVIGGYIYTYRHTPDGTEINTPNGKVLYHGHGSLYPGPLGSAFYVQNSNAILVDFA